MSDERKRTYGKTPKTNADKSQDVFEVKLFPAFQTLWTPATVGNSPVDKPWWLIAAALLAVILVSILVGVFASKQLRMKDYGWKISLILSSVGCALVIVVTGLPPECKTDLKQGVTLIYGVKQPEYEGQGIHLDGFVKALKSRVNPLGAKEVVIRPYGANRVEVVASGFDQDEVEQLKRKLVMRGVLKFRIVANHADHDSWLFTLAREPENFGGTWVYDPDKQRVGIWVRVARESRGDKKPYPLKVDVSDDLLRNAETKEILDNVPNFHSRISLSNWLEQQDIADIEVLVVVPDDEDVNVQGDHLAVVRSAMDQQGNPSISFVMTSEGEIRMGNLTSENKSRRLGIVFDDELISAPTIRSTITKRGEITGRFTKEEVDDLVSSVRAGRLPATLEKQPLSEDRIYWIDSKTGPDMRTKRIYAIGATLAVALMCMVAYKCLAVWIGKLKVRRT